MRPHELVILEIARERERQITQEGWTSEHDNNHSRGQIALAAAAYAEHASRSDGARSRGVSSSWPFGKQWWKPTTRRRDLVKAAALIVAEIERLDRAATAKQVA